MVLQCSLGEELALPLLVSDGRGQWREKSEVHVHRLKVPWICTRYIGDETAMSGRRRRRDQRQALKLADSIDAGEAAHRRRISVPFHTDQLSGEEEPVLVLEL
jgi:hypothetical protein